MKKVDPESEKFIAWALNYLDDEEVYHEFLLECRRKFQNFIARSPDEIKKRLAEKLVIGSAEHGAPKYYLNEVEKELEFEFIDILGWSLVGLWNERDS